MFSEHGKSGSKSNRNSRMLILEIEQPDTCQQNESSQCIVICNSQRVTENNVSIYSTIDWRAERQRFGDGNITPTEVQWHCKRLDWNSANCISFLMWVFRVGMGIHCLHCRLQSKETKVWRWEHQSRWSAVTLQEIRLEFCSLHFNVSLCFPRVSFQSRYRHRLQLRLFAWTDFSVHIIVDCRAKTQETKAWRWEDQSRWSAVCSDIAKD